MMLRLAMGAVVGAMFAANAAAADISDVKSGYNAEAFAGADNDWRRLTANRIGDCGSFGDRNTRRIDVLVDRYLAIGEALDAGDDAAAVAAAKRLSAAIEANTRFEGCWKAVARRANVSRDFAGTIAAL